MAKAKTTEKGSVALKNPKHELFAYLYVGYSNRDMFGNGTRCYMHVYSRAEVERLEKLIDELREKKPAGYSVKVAQYEARLKSIGNTARSNAAELLANTSILSRVNYLMDQLISNDFMDRELAYTAGQRFDLNAKVAAIREYNRLKDRAADKLEGTINFRWVDDAPAKKK